MQRSSSKRSKNVSENVPCQKNNDSNNGENWGGRWYARFIVVAALYDKGEGTKHSNDRERVCKPHKDLCKWCGIHFWPRLAVRWQVSCFPTAV
jgi:hypothetical protein